MQKYAEKTPYIFLCLCRGHKHLGTIAIVRQNIHTHTHTRKVQLCPPVQSARERQNEEMETKKKKKKKKSCRNKSIRKNSVGRVQRSRSQTHIPRAIVYICTNQMRSRARARALAYYFFRFILIFLLSIVPLSRLFARCLSYIHALDFHENTEEEEEEAKN